MCRKANKNLQSRLPCQKPGPGIVKLFFMLNSAENEMCYEINTIVLGDLSSLQHNTIIVFVRG